MRIAGIGVFRGGLVTDQAVAERAVQVAIHRHTDHKGVNEIVIFLAVVGWRERRAGSCPVACSNHAR